MESAKKSLNGKVGATAARSPAAQGKSASSQKPTTKITPEANQQLNFLVQTFQYAEENFDAKVSKHADWILIKLLLENDAEGRSTVVKHMIEASKGNAGTVRQIFNRFEKHGYITVDQKIGRSELFRPTAKLKRFVEKWARETSQTR